MYKIEEIRCIDDGGKIHIIQIRQKKLVASPKDEWKQVLGMKSLRTSLGAFVNLLDENTFEIVQTKTIVRRTAQSLTS